MLKPVRRSPTQRPGTKGVCSGPAHGWPQTHRAVCYDGQRDDKGASDLAALAAVQTAAVTTPYYRTAYIYRGTAYIETAPTAAIAVVAVAPSTSLSTSADGQPLVGQIDQEAPSIRYRLAPWSAERRGAYPGASVADYLLADASSPVASSAATVSSLGSSEPGRRCAFNLVEDLADEGFGSSCRIATFGVCRPRRWHPWLDRWFHHSYRQ
jgi:hypothetical protein